MNPENSVMPCTDAVKMEPCKTCKGQGYFGKDLNLTCHTCVGTGQKRRWIFEEQDNDDFIGDDAQFGMGA